MTKKLSGFKKEKDNEGNNALVKRFENGSYIAHSGEEFYAYNERGQYLGFSTEQDEAEFMAQNGFANQIDDISDLSLWVMWNDAVDSGEKPLEDPETGEQFLALPNYKTIISVQEGEHGWDVNIISEELLWEMYKHEKYDCLCLRIAEKPHRLE